MVGRSTTSRTQLRCVHLKKCLSSDRMFGVYVAREKMVAPARQDCECDFGLHGRSCDRGMEEDTIRAQMETEFNKKTD